MRILIVGAGVGGLALAALLRQREIGCLVVERSVALPGDGHVISLYPTGSRVLHGLQCYAEYEAVSGSLESYDIWNGDGHLLHRFEMQPAVPTVGETRQILRGDLVGLLHRACGGVEIRAGCEVMGMERREDAVAVRLSDGSREDFDGVVGCDGVRSCIRAMGFAGEPPEETGWGVGLWWNEDGAQPLETISEIWGHGWLVGIYPTPRRTAVVLAAPQESLDEAMETGRLRGVAGRAAGLLAGAPRAAGGSARWNLADLRVKHWVDGRVALLGDAACAFLPVAGTGASMALESAAVMADELTRCGAPGLPLAFSLYAKRRKPRVEAAQEDARRLAAWMTTASGAMAWTRDQFLKIASAGSLAAAQLKSLSEPI